MVLVLNREGNVKKSEFALLAVMLVVFTLILTSLSGCALFQSPQAAFVTGVDAGLNTSGLLDEYDKYVEADGALKGDSKKIRHETAIKLRKLILDAQGMSKPAPAPAPAPAPMPPK